MSLQSPIQLNPAKGLGSKHLALIGANLLNAQIKYLCLGNLAVPSHMVRINASRDGPSTFSVDLDNCENYFALEDFVAKSTHAT